MPLIWELKKIIPAKEHSFTGMVIFYPFIISTIAETNGTTVASIVINVEMMAANFKKNSLLIWSFRFSESSAFLKINNLVNRLLKKIQNL